MSKSSSVQWDHNRREKEYKIHVVSLQEAMMCRARKLCKVFAASIVVQIDQENQTL